MPTPSVTQVGPVAVYRFSASPRAVDVSAMTDPAKRAAVIANRATWVLQALSVQRDADAVRLAGGLAAALQRVAAARRDRPAFLHGALLDRAARALEDAAADGGRSELAEAREWLHALALTIGRTWSLRAGIGGPLAEDERAARRAVRSGAALLRALRNGALAEAMAEADRLAGELTLTQREREAAALRARAADLESSLDSELTWGGPAGVTSAAAALEQAALDVLEAVDPSDLGRPLALHPEPCPRQAGRHAGRGLTAYARRDAIGLADAAMTAAAHLRAPQCVESGWGEVADDLLDRVEGLRASLERQDRAAVRQAAQRVEIALARIHALAGERPAEAFTPAREEKEAPPSLALAPALDPAMACG